MNLSWFISFLMLKIFEVNSRVTDKDLMNIDARPEKRFRINHAEDSEDQVWKGRILSKLNHKIKDEDEDDDSGSGFEEEGSGNTSDDELENEEKGSGFEDDDLEDRETADSDQRANVTAKNKKKTTPAPLKPKGSWTLNCPSPCSQTCSPSCTPQCCMDNFAMAPPVPENIKEMYLCPSYCTGLSCSNSCPSYCCSPPEQPSMVLQTPPPEVFYAQIYYIQVCPVNCMAFPPNACPATCGPVCCNAPITLPPLISVTARGRKLPKIYR